MAQYGLEVIFSPELRPLVDIVCVHGFGGDADKSWQHEATGRVWAQDAEFLERLKLPVRVLAFRYNGDVAANLARESVTLHANDLMGFLLRFWTNNLLQNPMVFVAHGFGGTIVKKMIRLSKLSGISAPISQAIHGVVFLETPHDDADSASLLRTVRRTVERFGHEDSTHDDEEIRQFADLVAGVNRAFNVAKSPDLLMLSYSGKDSAKLVQQNWAQNGTWRAKTPLGSRPPAGLDLKKDPGQQGVQKMFTGADIMRGEAVDCDYIDLPRFADPFEERFAAFADRLREMMGNILDRPAVLGQLTLAGPPATAPSPAVVKSTKPSPVMPSPNQPLKVQEKPREGTSREPAADADWAEQKYKYWDRKHAAMTRRRRRDNFASSLRGWSEENLGTGVKVMPETCGWFVNDKTFNIWSSDPGCCVFFYLGSRGQGKTHLARAIAQHLASSRPKDIVMSFYCTGRERLQDIFSCFTWILVKRHTSWFNDVPILYHDRDASSPDLSMGSLVEIWKAFRQQGAPINMYLVIDGIERCGDAVLAELLDFIEQLRWLWVRPPPPPPSPPIPGQPSRASTMLKILLTCAPTDAVVSASDTTSRNNIMGMDTLSDISLFVDARLDKLAWTDGLPGGEELDRLKTSIKRNAGISWRYAKFAVGDIESSGSLETCRALMDDCCVPTGLRRWYDERVLPLFQSLGNEGYLKTVVIFLLEFLPPNVNVVEDVLSGVYGREAMSRVNLRETLRDRCSDLFVLQSRTPVFLAHRSFKPYFARYLSEEERKLHLAWVCLRYLLRDEFREATTLMAAEGSQKKKPNERFPFYDFAATRWAGFIRDSESHGYKILPLLRVFLADECPQYKTWAQWRISHDPEPIWGSQRIPKLLPLIVANCMNVLEHLLPCPSTQRTNASSWSRMMDWVLGSPKASLPSVEGWPAAGDRDYHWTSLMAAVFSRNIDVVRHILQFRTDINARDVQGRTAIMLAPVSAMSISSQPSSSLMDIMTELLARGADPNISDNKGKTCLHFACRARNIDMVRLLLVHGAYTDVVDIYGRSPLEEAAMLRDAGIVQSLVDSGADLSMWWTTANSALCQAILDQDLELFRIFLLPADVNQHNELGIAPIHQAVMGNGVHSTEFLLLLLAQPGLDLDLMTKTSGVKGGTHDRRANAVKLAVRCGNGQALRILLEAGAWPGDLPDMGRTPLYAAVSDGRFDMAELLLRHGAPVNSYVRGRRHATALGKAVDLGNEELVRLLLEYGADATLEEAFGVRGPLHFASAGEPPNATILRMLCESKFPPDVDYTPEGKASPLMNVVWSDCDESVRCEVASMLISDYGVSLARWLEPEVKDSPIHDAACDGLSNICKLLLEHEPRFLDAKFETGFICETPLNLACRDGRKDVVRLLLDKGAKANLKSFHYESSSLLLAAEYADIETTEIILEAAPEMVNVPNYLGFMPLTHACMRGDLKIVEKLLERGADFRLWDCFGETPASSCLSKDNPTPYKAISLLMERGLDLYEVVAHPGLTILAVAVREYQVRNARDLLEKGVDPLRCSQNIRNPEQWTNALHVASHSRRSDMVDLLLEPQWRLRERLADVNWFGFTALPMLAPTRDKIEVVTRIFWACEDVRAETGRDMFSEMIDQPCINGLTPLDYALNRTGCTPAALPKLEESIKVTVDHLLSLPSIPLTHVRLLGDLVLLLLLHNDFDDEIAILETIIITMPNVLEDESGIHMDVMPPYCDLCSGAMASEGHMCRLCGDYWCGKCSNTSSSLHDHVWLEMKFVARKDVDADVRAELTKIRGVLASKSEAREALPTLSEEEGEEEKAEGKEEASQVQSSSALSLAVLHAFNFLAVPRRLFTPFLPLTSQVEEMIAPWSSMIAPRQQLLERQILEDEDSQQRREEEMRYMTRGLRRGYADEELVKADMVLTNVQWLFNED